MFPVYFFVFGRFEKSYLPELGWGSLKKSYVRTTRMLPGACRATSEESRPSAKIRRIVKLYNQ